MGKVIDLTDVRFSFCVAKKLSGFDIHKQALWHCLCDCGNAFVTKSANLRKGDTKSCGCYNQNQLKKGKTLRHGLARSSEYKAWSDMKKRCFNKNNKAYKFYGARNITVCDRWIESFDNFISDMGLKPSKKHSLDRIDNDGNYSPENCRWTTATIQLCNKRKLKKATSLYKGVFFSKQLNKWRSKFSFKGKEYLVGTFKTQQEAALAYNKKVIEIRGKNNSYLNKV